MSESLGPVQPQAEKQGRGPWPCFRDNGLAWAVAAQLSLGPFVPAVANTKWQRQNPNRRNTLRSGLPAPGGSLAWVWSFPRSAGGRGREVVAGQPVDRWAGLRGPPSHCQASRDPEVAGSAAASPEGGAVNLETEPPPLTPSPFFSYYFPTRGSTQDRHQGKLRMRLESHLSCATFLSARLP